VTSRGGRRSRIPFGLLLIALGVAVGIAAYVLGRADESNGIPPASPEAHVIPEETAGATPSPSPSPDPRGKLLIHGTGDVSLDPSYISAFRSNGYGWAWSGLRGLFERDDLTVINHECPSTDVVAPRPKTFVFRCDLAALDEARRAGVDANLADNHGFDQGPRGLLDSIRNIRRAGIVPVGAGTSQQEADAPAYIEVKG
jgi:Bacterial capsule synthesis protein PGA_cap